MNKEKEVLINLLLLSHPYSLFIEMQNVNTGLNGYVRSQEDKYPAGDVGIGEVNKITADFALKRP